MSILYYKRLLINSVVLVFFLISCTAFASSKHRDVSVPPNYMFLQNAKLGILKSTKKQGIYQLILTNVQPYVTYFSDRPNRITGLMSIDNFLKEWQSNVTSGFKKDAPNVGIEGIKLNAFSRSQPISVVMVLSNPIYDKKANTLTYTAHELDAKYAPVVKDGTKLENIALFIDNIGSCPSCCCGFH
ncbi:hypothetical protein TUM19329_04940 [Legionella antarctica]|uniref:Uncharacterized protein n=1 Tax=Legionella antarctica TaxID=2708020 RepID=A0A6F8T1N3_9GAMM|nr:hypothetical protein [Legionella antarctica]BCA94133.1 hypothetical protein TUM19329_04940 [Legionella antarctica]